MGWWSQLLPKEEVNIDELQEALKEHEAAFANKLKQTKKTKDESTALLNTAEKALDILSRTERKKYE